MYLKNYTSEVAPSITIGRIQALLLKCGVKGIAMEYGDNQDVKAITFQIPVMGRDAWVRLPADVEQTQEAMWQNYKKDHPENWVDDETQKDVVLDQSTKVKMVKHKEAARKSRSLSGSGRQTSN